MLEQFGVVEGFDNIGIACFHERNVEVVVHGFVDQAFEKFEIPEADIRVVFECRNQLLRFDVDTVFVIGVGQCQYGGEDTPRNRQHDIDAVFSAEEFYTVHSIKVHDEFEDGVRIIICDFGEVVNQLCYHCRTVREQL